jgi:hypothetical protein
MAVSHQVGCFIHRYSGAVAGHGTFKIRKKSAAAASL